MNLGKMPPWLLAYPEQQTVFLIKGFADGFYLPVFTSKGCQLVKILRTVHLCPHIVRDKEIAKGWVEGPFDSLLFDSQ